MAQLEQVHPTPSQDAAVAELEQYRRALTGYCYRMLGSAFEAEDAVQETLLRAWRGLDRFEGRAAMKSWLYRIATNVCLDMLSGRERRARPMDLGPAGPLDGELGTLPDAAWIEPMPDARVSTDTSDPAEQAVARETLRLAFVAALQHLPPRQRAVLILREVLRWRATEVAELLETSVASVNSSLQRARAGLESADVSTDASPMGSEEQALLERYVDAFEAYDIESLVALLHEDATMSMPPHALWLRGPEAISAWWTGRGSGCRGSRLVAAATTANGLPAFGQYRPGGPDGSFTPWALALIDISEGRIRAIGSFLDTERLFPLFGLPARVER
jgi:RNA polymerase sigma-70 factor (ECF subfamily)